MTPNVSIAILDDYASLAKPFFTSIPNATVDSFPGTLSPITQDGLAQLIDRLQPYDIISTMRERTAFPAELLSKLPNLRLLLTTGLRNASIDMAYCASHNITVTGAAGTRPVYHDSTGAPIPTDASHASPSPPEGTVSTTIPIPKSAPSSTTQHTLSLLLALTSRITTDHTALTTPPHTAWQSGLTFPLPGSTIGIIGLGKLGTAFAAICHRIFACRILAWSSSLTQSSADAAAAAVGLHEPGTFTCVTKDELFTDSDVVSVHYVLSSRSKGIVGAEDLTRMKTTAFLVNTARGPLIDEDALYDVLTTGKIAGAALDVYWEEGEPLPATSRWRTTPWGRDGRARVVLSPHMGYVNERTMRCWYEEQRCEVVRFLEGAEQALRLA